MTEYLIILSIIAIAAIAVVGLFGQQIKETFHRNTGAMSGTTVGNAAAQGITDSSKTAAGKQENMSGFDNAATGGN